MAVERVVLDVTVTDEALIKFDEQLRKSEGNATELEKAISKVNAELEEQIKLEREEAREIKTLQDRLKQLVKLQQESTDTTKQKEYIKEIQATKTALSALEKVEKGRARTISNLEKEMGKLEKASKKAGESGKNAFKDLFDSVADGVPQVDKIRGIFTKFKGAATPVGIVATAVVGLGAAALDTSFQISQIADQIQGLTGVTNREVALNQAAAVKSLASTYNIDLKEAIIATNAAAKNLGGDFNAAIEEVNNALAGGLRFSDEYLENLKEYPSALSLTLDGLSDFNALIAVQQQEGFFNDKLVDTIKEFEISIRELTPATRDAFGNAGLGGALEQFESGAIDAQQLLQLTGRRIQELGPKSKEVGAIMADVFRGAGEDSIVPLSRVFANFSERLNDAKDRMNELGEAERNLFEAQTRLNQALASESVKDFTNFLTNAKAGLIGFAAGFISALESGERFKAFILSLGASEKVRSAELQKQNEAQARFVNAQKRVADLQKRINTLREAGVKSIGVERISEQVKGFNDLTKASENQISTLKGLNGTLSNLEVLYEKELAALAKLKAQKKENGKDRKDTINSLDALKEKLKELQEAYSATGSAAKRAEIAPQILNLKIEIESLENAIDPEQVAKLQERLRKEAIKLKPVELDSLLLAPIEPVVDPAKIKTSIERANGIILEGRLSAAAEEFAQAQDLTERRFNIELLSTTNNQRQIQRLEKDYRERSLQNEIDFLRNIIKARKEAGQNTIEDQKALNDALLELDKIRAANAAKIQQESFDGLISAFSQISSTLASVTDEGGARQIQALGRVGEALTNLVNKSISAEEAIAAIATAGLDIIGGINQRKADQELALVEEQKAATNERYANEREQLQQTLDATNATNEQRTAALEALNKREESSNARLNAKKEAIQKDLAKKEQNIAIGKALISGALAIVQAFNAAAGNPILGGIFAAIIAGITAAQIGVIKSQKFAEGGYTGKGHGKRDETGEVPAGIVHENEFVVPRRMVENPTESKMIAYMESVRKGKPNTALLKQYIDKKGIFPDVTVRKPLAEPVSVPQLSRKTVKDSAIKHIEIKSGRVDIDYDRLTDLMKVKLDSDYQSESLFKLLREQQNSNLQLRAELMNVKEEIKKLKR